MVALLDGKTLDAATMIRQIGQPWPTMARRLGRPDQRLETPHGLDRCRYHGLDGMKRWVGLGVIADNLVSTGTFSKAAVTS